MSFFKRRFLPFLIIFKNNNIARLNIAKVFSQGNDSMYNALFYFSSICSQDIYETDGHPNSSSLSHYGADGTWEMYGYSIQTDPPIQDKSTITYHFYMHRRSSFYVITFIAPVSEGNSNLYVQLQTNPSERKWNNLQLTSIRFVHRSLNNKSHFYGRQYLQSYQMFYLLNALKPCRYN